MYRVVQKVISGPTVWNALPDYLRNEIPPFPLMSSNATFYLLSINATLYSALETYCASALGLYKFID